MYIAELMPERQGRQHHVTKVVIILEGCVTGDCFQLSAGVLSWMTQGADHSGIASAVLQALAYLAYHVLIHKAYNMYKAYTIYMYAIMYVCKQELCRPRVQAKAYHQVKEIDSKAQQYGVSRAYTHAKYVGTHKSSNVSDTNIKDVSRAVTHAS